jgi:hypothetical protein
MPDLVVGVIRVRDARERSADQGAGIVAYVAELAATVHNRGDALADETTTRFWVRGPTSTGNCGSSIPPHCRPATRSRSPLCGTSATVE